MLPISPGPDHEHSGHRQTILVVDDVPANLELLARLLEGDGYRACTASNGPDALDAVRRERPDLVLLDILMPGLDGYEVCRRIKSDPATRLTPVVLITGLRDSEDRIRGINAGADDFLTKPVNAPELSARVRSLVRLKRYTDELDSAESVIISLALTIEARDRYTQGHCERLASYSTALGAELGLSDDDLGALYRGGFLHDLGKVGIPDALLLKGDRFTPEEFEQMKQHTIIGDRLCGQLRSLDRVRPIVRHHHERYDGSGYPDGLRGDDIPLLAQIMAIVDVYDALTTERPYKATLTPDEAFDALAGEAALGWHRPDLVQAFTEMARRDQFHRLTPGQMIAASTFVERLRS